MDDYGFFSFYCLDLLRLKLRLNNNKVIKVTDLEPPFVATNFINHDSGDSSLVKSYVHRQALRCNIACRLRKQTRCDVARTDLITRGDIARVLRDIGNVRIALVKHYILNALFFHCSKPNTELFVLAIIKLVPERPAEGVNPRLFFLLHLRQHEPR